MLSYIKEFMCTLMFPQMFKYFVGCWFEGGGADLLKTSWNVVLLTFQFSKIMSDPDQK